MAFMSDSERAAEIAQGENLEIGFHLNLTEDFDGKTVPAELREHQAKIRTYLSKGKLSQILYNPKLSESFRATYEIQLEEIVRLYGRAPDFINGHHHSHLTANVLLGRFMPRGERVRGTFTFGFREKSLANFLYRQVLNVWVRSFFLSTKYFYSIVPFDQPNRLQDIMSLAKNYNVELEVHPENLDELDFLLGEKCQELFNTIRLGCFRDL